MRLQCCKGFLTKKLPLSVLASQHFLVRSHYLVKGFIAVIIGGLGSVPGAIVGSLFIGLIESFGGFYFDPSMANIAIFVLVMIILLVRPNGLMGNG
jgi:branched-chain amino acid transport system permease protein